MKNNDSRLSRKGTLAVGGVMGGAASLAIASLMVRMKVAKPVNASLITAAAMGGAYLYVDDGLLESAALGGTVVASAQALLTNSAQSRLRELASEFSKTNKLSDDQTRQIEAVVNQFLRNADDVDDYEEDDGGFDDAEEFEFVRAEVGA